MPLIPLRCPSCNSITKVNSDLEHFECAHCGTISVMKDIIVNNYIQYTTNYSAETMNFYNQKDFVIKAGVLIEYNGESANVTIPETVSVIGSNVFSGLRIERVEIPKSVAIIEQRAFFDCYFLSSVVIHNGVEHIDDEAFCNCTSLSSIAIPNSVKIIGKKAFSDCTKLKSLSIHNGVEYIDDEAFANCTSLPAISIPSSVKAFGHNVFSNCTSLTNVSIPNIINGIFYVFPNTPYYENYQEIQYKKTITAQKWRRAGKCQHCGGAFKGLLHTKCISCGKPRDYSYYLSSFLPSLREFFGFGGNPY